MDYTKVTDNTGGEFFDTPDATYESRTRDTIGKRLFLSPFATHIMMAGDKVTEFIKTITPAKKHTRKNGKCAIALGEGSVGKDSFSIETYFDNGASFCERGNAQFMNEAEAMDYINESLRKGLNKHLIDQVTVAATAGALTLTTKEEAETFVAELAMLEDDTVSVTNVKYGEIKKAEKAGKTFILATSKVYARLGALLLTRKMEKCCGIKGNSIFSVIEGLGIDLVNIGPKEAYGDGTKELAFASMGGIPVIGTEKDSAWSITDKVTAFDKATIADMDIVVDDKLIRNGKVVAATAGADAHIFAGVKDKATAYEVTL